MVLRGLARADGRHAGARPTDPGVWVEAEPVTETPAPSPAVRVSWRASTARSSAGSRERLGSPRFADALAGRRRPRRARRHRRLVARPVGRAQGGAARDARPRGAPREGARAGRATRSPSSRCRSRSASEVSDDMDKTQREFLLRQQLDGDPQGAGRAGDDEDVVDEYRTQARRKCELPDDGPRDAIEREIDRLERTQRAEPRARLDPHVARHRARAAVGHALRRSLDVGDARASPRRRPHRPRRREGPHRRVPRGAQAARRARA